jgi:protease I
MKRALVVTATGFRDHEVVYPYYRLKGAGFHVDLVGDRRDDRNRIYGVSNVNMPCDILLSEFNTNWQSFLDSYDFLVIPGGVVAMEKLRLVKPVIQFTSEWNRRNKVIASICQGAQILISAQVVAGRSISGYYNLEDDIVNAGARFVDAPAVVDNNIICSPHYDFMGEWMETALEVYGKLNDKS